MKRSNFGKQRAVFILKQMDDGMGIEDVCHNAGVFNRPTTDGARNTAACCHQRRWLLGATEAPDPSS